MPISYPLTLPASPVPRSVVPRGITTVGINESPFTLQQQVYDWGGDRLEYDVVYPPMKRPDAEIIINFLLSLRGKLGTFYMSPWGALLPQGSSNVTLAYVSGTVGLPSITISTSASASFVAGDYLQQNHTDFARLYKIVKSNSRSGSGNITLDIFPVLRSPSPAVSAAATTQSPVGLFRLSTNKREWPINEALVYGVQFSCVEAL